MYKTTMLTNSNSKLKKSSIKNLNKIQLYVLLLLISKLHVRFQRLLNFIFLHFRIIAECGFEQNIFYILVDNEKYIILYKEKNFLFQLF